MKDKIIAAIKAKFPDVNLSAKRLDAIADKLTPKVTDENEIDAQIDVYNDYNPISEIAKTDDTVRDLKGKLKTAPKAPDTQSSSTTTTTETVPDEAPAWAKALIESNQQLSQKLASMEKEKQVSTMQQKLSAHEKLKGISPVFFKGRALPEKEEDLEAFVDGIKTDYDSFKQESNNEILIGGTKPVGGTAGQTGKVSSMFQEVMAMKKAEAASQQK